MGGGDHVQEVLVEVGADELSAARPEARLVQLLEERGDPGRHDRVEHRVCAARCDLFDRRAVVGVVEREVLLADDRPAVRRDGLPDPRVQHVGPDVVGRRQIESPRAGLPHQPGDEGVDLLRGHRAGAEDQRIGLLPLVLLGVDVERLPLVDGRPLDGLPRRAVDAAHEDVDPVFPHELLGLLGRDGVVGRAVLETELEPAPQQPAVGVEVGDDHSRHVGVGHSDERERARQIGDHSYVDRCCLHGVLLKIEVVGLYDQNSSQAWRS